MAARPEEKRRKKKEARHTERLRRESGIRALVRARRVPGADYHEGQGGSQRRGTRWRVRRSRSDSFRNVEVVSRASAVALPGGPDSPVNMAPSPTVHDGLIGEANRATPRDVNQREGMAHPHPISRHCCPPRVPSRDIRPPRRSRPRWDLAHRRAEGPLGQRDDSGTFPARRACEERRGGTVTGRGCTDGDLDPDRARKRGPALAGPRFALTPVGRFPS
jgi:hypothetical protein